MVQGRDDVVGLDSSVILPARCGRRPATSTAFVDPLTECQSCHKRFRADHLQGLRGRKGREPQGAARYRLPALRHQGRVDRAPHVQRAAAHVHRPGRGRSGLAYLRPETAQGIFVNFKNVSSRRARSPRSASRRSASRSATRSRRATSSSAPASSSRWRWSSSSSRAPTRSGTSTGSRSAGTGTSAWACRPDNLRLLRAPQGEAVALLQAHRRHRVPVRLRRHRVGRARGHRQPHRLRPDDHAAASGADLSYQDQATGERCTPYVIEPAAGLSRATLAFLLDAYAEDEAPNTKGGVDKRVVLRLDPRLAPVKVAVLPLSRNADLSPVARDLAAELRRQLERRLRRRRRDRPALPPPGRDRHAVLRHGRLRDPRGPGRDRARARLDGPGAHLAGPGHGVPD